MCRYIQITIFVDGTDKKIRWWIGQTFIAESFESIFNFYCKNISYIVKIDFSFALVSFLCRSSLMQVTWQSVQDRVDLGSLPETWCICCKSEFGATTISSGNLHVPPVIVNFGARRRNPAIVFCFNLLIEKYIKRANRKSSSTRLGKIRYVSWNWKPLLN